MRNFKKLLLQNSLLIIYLISLISTIGSLYFSEIVHLEPCTLCWYQRIAMYPIALLSLVGILKKSDVIFPYLLPLSIIGQFLALYNYFLQKSPGTVKLVQCSRGKDCASVDFEVLGFVTIPLLSFVAFSIISTVIVMYLEQAKGEKLNKI